MGKAVNVLPYAPGVPTLAISTRGRMNYAWEHKNDGSQVECEVSSQKGNRTFWHSWEDL